MKQEFKPKIIGFLCNWCAYAGADLAGVSRLQYPSELRVVRVMCSGRIDPVWIFRAFGVKIDGVLVLGCHLGDCHYQTGNYQAERKAKFIKRILKKCGIDEKRFSLDWVSASEGSRFAEIVTSFTNLISKMPPIADTEDLEEKIDLALKMSEMVRLRWLVGKEWDITTQGNAYNELIEQDRLDEVMNRNIDQVYLMFKLSHILSNAPMNPLQIAEKLGASPKEVFSLLVKMEGQGLVQLHDEVDHYPRFVKK